ncbi:MAG: MFS transporter [Candidatus Thorarchaeota archaeon]
MTTSSNSTKSILPILIINFISTLSFSIILPFLFILVDDYGGNAFIYGILGATYSVFQLVGSPILGSWSDKFGRRPILFLSQFGTLLSWIVFLLTFFLNPIKLFNIDSSILGTFTLSLPLVAIFFARGLDGITGGNVSVANAYLADISTNENRTKNFGLMSVSANLGFVIGPTLAGLLGNTNLGLQLPVFVAVIIALVGLVLIIVLMKPIDKRDETQQQDKKENKSHSFKQILNIPHMKLILFMNFVIFLGFNFFYISFPVFIIKDVHWTELELGFLLTLLSICMVIVQGPILSKISNRISTNNLMMLGSIILTIGFAIIVLREVYYLYSSMILIALGNGLLYPSLVATLSNHAGEEFQGAAQGYATSSGSLASILGLIIGGIFYEVFKSLLFIFSALTIAILLIMIMRLRMVEKEHKLEQKCLHGFMKNNQAIVETCDPFSVPKTFKDKKDLTIV